MKNWRVVLAAAAVALLATGPSAAEQTQVEKVQAALDDWLAKQGPVEKVTGIAAYVSFSNRPVGVKHVRLSTTAVSMSLTGSCFSSESTPRPFHHGIRRRGGTIFGAALPLDQR
jgi:hypothetical protein